MELFYRVWQDEGRTQGRLAYEQCLSLPLIVVHEDAVRIPTHPDHCFRMIATIVSE